MSDYYFMDNETYEQIHLSEEIIGNQGVYMKEGQVVQVLFHESNPISFELPPHVELAVISSPPSVKGNTATGASKQITLETGAVINAPLFINEGDIVKIDTRTNEYIERVKT
jgi:elongation factor P